MLGADQGATARHARALCAGLGSLAVDQDAFGHIALDQRVVDFLAQRRGTWFCDSCLALVLGLLEQHAVDGMSPMTWQSVSPIVGAGALVTIAGDKRS